MYNMESFALSDMTRCGIELRRLGQGAGSMEETAQKIADYFYKSLRKRDDLPACALVRMYVTAPYSELQQDLQEFATGLVGEATNPAMKCLTLLGTAGEESDWNSRKKSAGHKALPLESAESIAKSPMINALIHQLGIPVASLLDAGHDIMLDEHQHTFNVFHVPDAQGSPYIPAQENFVIPHKIRSVLGFGGMLPNGEMFAIVMFSKLTIPRERAELFNTLALNAKLALLPFAGKQLFNE
ncbi:MAG TPA: hypothetical protein VM939_11250 [Gemmatimonadaceae bacterium]|nr:hypothetical protein [Gemmatimonadaceae bacterium]